MKLKESCGLFGVFGHKDAVRLAYYGLFAQQHRGQESAGIAATDGGAVRAVKGMGLVQEVLGGAKLQGLSGDRAIGHVRYSTTGSPNLMNAQPIVVNYARGRVALGHNGNLVNGAELRDECEARGSIFQSSTDSEVIVHLLAQPTMKGDREHLKAVLAKLRGAFSLIFLMPDAVVAVRDPNGWRPLALGEVDGAPVVASETCAFDLIHARYVRDVEPGEMVWISADGIESARYAEPTEPTFCIFEHVYFARPDSAVNGLAVHEVRKRIGRRLAREHPADADVVIPVPDSGNSAALGYSLESGIPLDSGFIRNHYVGRTFIQPTQGERDRDVEVKLNVVRSVVEGRRVVVVDDSVIRGTTAKSRVRYLRRAGAREVHLRISCPPTRHPCFYGIDFPDPKELIAANHSLEEIRGLLDLDSLGYVSLEGMLEAARAPGAGYCSACWSGVYPVPIKGRSGKLALER